MIIITAENDKISSVGGCGGWSWKGVKQMAPFVLLCLNSPNCYALFAVPLTLEDHDDDDDDDDDADDDDDDKNKGG